VWAFALAGAFAASACSGRAESTEPELTKQEVCGIPAVPLARAAGDAGSGQARDTGLDAGASDAGTSVRGPGHWLLAIDPRVRPYRVTVPEICVSEGETYSSIVSICVDESGFVSDVTILQPSIRFIDDQLPVVIRRWRYEPYLVDGRPTPFCYPLRYTVAGSPQ
jgi:hypothetical protein